MAPLVNLIRMFLLEPALQRAGQGPGEGLKGAGKIRMVAWYWYGSSTNVWASGNSLNGTRPSVRNSTRLRLAGLLWQSVYSRLADYEDGDDAERLSQDPAFRLIGSKKGLGALGSFYLSRTVLRKELLTQEENLAGLARINRELCAKAEVIDSPGRVVLNMDGTEIPVYGEHKQSAYNGHFESTSYHPLLLFNCDGDSLAAKLRPGRSTAPKARTNFCWLEIDRQQAQSKEVAFRGDAASAKPEPYEVLEERHVEYAIRLPANDNL